MNPSDPIQSLWLGKIQTELGVQISNGLLAEAKIEALQHELTKAYAQLEAQKSQIEAMGQTNTNLRETLESLKKVRK